MRLIAIIFLGVMLTIQPVSAASLSEEQKGAISQNCNSIKSSLRSLQKTDSRTRVLLGTSYQTILTNFLTPLNLRLVKNNQSSPSLSTAQADIASERNLFQERFIKYSQRLEELITTDCQQNPEEFYDKLQTTRTERSALNKSAKRINSLIQQHIIDVSALKDSETKL